MNYEELSLFKKEMSPEQNARAVLLTYFIDYYELPGSKPTEDRFTFGERNNVDDKMESIGALKNRELTDYGKHILGRFKVVYTEDDFDTARKSIGSEIGQEKVYSILSFIPGASFCELEKNFDVNSVNMRRGYINKTLERIVMKGRCGLIYFVRKDKDVLFEEI